MTPTEQDKELKSYIVEQLHSFDREEEMFDTYVNRFLQLITADRKRAELEARISSEQDTLNTLIKAWDGTYDDANDILQLLIDNSRLGIKNLEQELEKL